MRGREDREADMLGRMVEAMRQGNGSHEGQARRAAARRTAAILGMVAVAIFVYYILKTMLR